jgi:hypothetical protein
MTIEFTNLPIRPDKLNVALFKMKDGSLISVNRKKESWYTEKDGSYTGRWGEVYLWGVNNFHSSEQDPIFVSDDGLNSLMNNSTSVDFSLADKSPAVNKMDFSGVTFSAQRTL